MKISSTFVPQENLNTLGDEIAKMSRQNQQLDTHKWCGGTFSGTVSCVLWREVIFSLVFILQLYRSLSLLHFQMTRGFYSCDTRSAICLNICGKLGFVMNVQFVGFNCATESSLFFLNKGEYYYTANALNTGFCFHFALFAWLIL